MADEPLGGVVVTAKEIYDAVNKLTSKIDSLIEGQQMSRDVAKDHEHRLRALERTRWPLPSVAVLVALASLLVAIIR